MILNACQLRVPKRITATIAGMALGEGEDEEEELILLTIEDITERKQLEEELKASEERFRRAFETSLDGLLLVHKVEGSILNSNAAAQKLLSYSQEEFLKERLWDIGVTKDVKDFQEMISRLTADGVIYYKDVQVKTKQGLGRSSDVFLVDKTKVLQCNIRDITERKQAEQAALEVAKAKGAAETMEKKMAEIQAAYKELKETQSLLIQSEKMAALGVLSAGVAHELNNPLTGILSTSRYYVDHKDLQAEERNAFKEITHASERMAKIVKGLLHYSVPATGVKEELDCCKVIEFVLDFSHKILLGDDVDVEKSFEKDLPMVKADRNQLEQVIIIIISNAIDAMEKKGIIKISARSVMALGSRFVELEFTDSACGIKKEDLLKLFDPFFTTKRPGKGTGLGLAVAHSIIQGHGGEISVESPPMGQERGASFKVMLPVATGA
ncbi:MAG: PAS domain S-box protein [Candidatus Omnitrophica bacterium]|nr:PAS domain S-box protein [Candidatus Omnitrophota bacterium]